MVKVARAVPLAGVFGLLPAAGPGEPPAPPSAVVAFVVDTSGSVGREPLSRAAGLLAGTLDHLPPGAEAAVFTFDDEARLVLTRTADRRSVRNALARAKVAGRRTALYDALYDAGRYLRGTAAERTALVIVTDGRDEDSALVLQDGLRLAQTAGIPVHTVGIGRADERVLRRIAKLTGGTYTPLRGAAPFTMAARIAGGPPAATLGETRGPSPLARPASASVVIEAEPRGRATSRGSAGTAWPAVLAVAAVLAAAAALLLSRRRASPAPGGRPGTASMAATSIRLSPTVLARLSVTEEYLEKTVTLEPRPVLSITRGPGAGASYELNGSTATSIGRAKANDIVLEDVSVSNQHCRVRPEQGRFVLYDLQSTNGTFVNERKVRAHQPLAEGDLVQVGETWIQFRMEHRRTA